MNIGMEVIASEDEDVNTIHIKCTYQWNKNEAEQGTLELLTMLCARSQQYSALSRSYTRTGAD